MAMTIAIDKSIMNKMPHSCKECPLTYLDTGDDAYFGACERRCVLDGSCVDGMTSERACDCQLVEAIPKAEYEARLKADMVAMLKEIKSEIEELESRAGYIGNGMPTFSTDYVRKKIIVELIQQKIDLQKQTTDNCDNCFNGTTKGGCAVKELMKNKDCKYYMPREKSML